MRRTPAAPWPTWRKERADLAIIALPPAEVPAALELAGRMAAARHWSSPAASDADEAGRTEENRPARGHASAGAQLAGFPAPALQLNASVAGPLAAGPAGAGVPVGRTDLVHAGLGRSNGVGFLVRGVAGAQHLGRHCAGAGFSGQRCAQTHSIVVYMEGISNARRFMSALRSAANAKPVVVLKAGRKPAGNEAAQTHSGAIVGSDDVFDAALRRAGAVRVRSFVELFSAAKCLASRYRPVGKRLAIVTNGGGPGVLAADWVKRNIAAAGQAVARVGARSNRSCPPWHR
jgi:acetyltransferase